jgi:thioredoxin 1
MVSAALVAVLALGAADKSEKPEKPEKAEKGVDFFKGAYQEALKKAEEKKTPLFIDLFTDWCGWCKVLDKQVFADAQFAAYMNSKFFAYKLNAEKDDDGPDVQKRFGVRGYPTALIIDPKTGEEIDRIVGFKPAEEYVKALKEILGGNSFAARKKKAKDNPEDIEAWAAYAKALEDRDPKAAGEAWKKVAALDPKDEKGKGSEALLAVARIETMEKQNPAPVVEFARSNDGKPVALKAHKMITEMLGQSPDPEHRKLVLASYEYLVGHGKKDAETLNGYAWTLATANQDLEKALGLVQEALKEKPDSAEYLDTLAECLSKLGRKDEAVAAARMAVEKADPKNPRMADFLKRRLAQFEKDAKAGTKDAKK